MSMSLMSFWYKATADLGLPTYKISAPQLITNQFIEVKKLLILKK